MISIRSRHSRRALATQRSAIALPRIVNYIRSARSVPTRPGDAPVPPLCGQDFEFVEHRQNWGEDRVCLHEEDGQLFSLPAGWTDAAAADPFVVIAAGRCPFTTDGLLALADLADRLRAQRDGAGAVKRIMP